MITMTKLPRITESEWAIMKELWSEAPLTAAQLVERVQKEIDLAVTTVKTLLRRLIAKGAVKYSIDENNAKLYYYFPLVTENECVIDKGKRFLSVYCNDNIEKMLTTFVDSTELTDDEIDKLKEILDGKKNRHE